MRLPVVEGQPLSSGVSIIVGSVQLQELVHRTSTPWRDARTKNGYQRRPAMGRIAKLMNEIRRGRVDIPTAVLLNAEHPSWKTALSYSDDNLFFDMGEYRGLFSVVDGQHRILALKHLHDEDPEKYGEFRLQFVMMLGASQYQELEQFYVVNSTAKSVKTDLALDLLKQRAQVDGSIMQGLIESGQDWKVRAQELTEKLADNSDVWRKRIRLANEIKGVTTIPSASFVTSLKRFLTYPVTQNLSQDKQYQILETYWLGVRDALPEPFKRVNEYTLMKGIGVWAMHEILPDIIEVIRSEGRSLFDSDNYAAIVSPMLEELEGENTDAELVRGHEFWLTAPKGGAAGGFSSSAGKRVLLSKLRNGLPEPDIE